MSDISEEDVNAKSEMKFSIKLKQSLDSSNNSQNDDELFFSSNCLIMHSNTISKTNPNHINKKDMFDSMDIDVKKKLFSSEVAPQKSENKRSYEGTSTEPTTSIRVRNYKSPKKRYSVFKLIEKEKKTKKEFSRFVNQKEEKELTPKKKERTDIFGNVISKKNKKKVKVSFIDKVTSQSLVNVIEIESFKNYNYIYGMPKEEKIDKSANCKCCLIF